MGNFGETGCLVNSRQPFFVCKDFKNSAAKLNVFKTILLSDTAKEEYEDFQYSLHQKSGKYLKIRVLQ